VLAPWPSTVLATISGIIDEIGRDVELVYVWSTSACTVCDLDPVTNTSVDSFCPTCSGDYWIPIYSSEYILSHVTWKFDYENEFSQGGKVLIGDARVKFMHTEAREELVRETEYIVLDGKIMNVEKTTLLGTPINRIILDLKQKED
jgi:hypothetical protein